MPKQQPKLSAQAKPRNNPWWQSPKIAALTCTLLIVCSIFLVYWPAIHGGFLLDDDLLLTDNALVKAPDGLSRIWFTHEPVDYWPLTNSTFWLEWRLWRMNPTGYHVVNLMLHTVNALLVWLLLKRLAIPGAFFGALLFALHPVNVESVAWIAQLKNVLSMLFFLLSLLCYLQAHRNLNRWYVLSLLTFILAMLSKGSVAILPLVLWLLIWWQRGRLTGRDVWQTMPFFVVALLLIGVNIWFQTHGSETVIRNVTFAQRLAGAGAALWFYLYQTLLPIHLSFVYPQWNIDPANPLWWLSLIAAVVVTLLLLYACLKTPRFNWPQHLLFAWGVFVASLLPVLGFVDVGYMKYSLVADHYLYIPIIPVVALLGAIVSLWCLKAASLLRPAIVGTAIAFVGACAWLSWNQTQLYGNSITLYQATLERNPDSWLIRTNLSIDLNDADRPGEALPHAREALHLKPDYAEAHNALGLILAKLGKPDEAVEQYQQSLGDKPNFAEAYCNLGAAYGAKGQLPQAIDYLQRAVELKPYFFEAQSDLARALAGAGQLDEALGHLQIAVQLRPDFVEGQMNLGNILFSLNHFPAAAEHFAAALQLQPNFPEANFALAQADAALNRPAQALAAAQQAIQQARSQHKSELAEQIATWLASYPAQQTQPTSH